MLARIAGYSNFVASGQVGFPPGQSLNRVMPAFIPAVSQGDAILVWATISNGGVAGGAITLTDNFNSGSYTLLAQIDDTGSGQASWYLYAMFNSVAAPANSLIISATFPVLIWHGLFAFDVTGVPASPLVVTAVKNWQVAVGTGANAITTGNIAAGAKPVIMIAGVMNSTALLVTPSAGPDVGTTPAFTLWAKDLNWNTSGSPGLGPENTPDAPTATFEYLTSLNPGTIPATFTAASGDSGDNYLSIGVTLFASPDIAPPGRQKRRGRQGGLTMGLNLAEWF